MSKTQSVRQSARRAHSTWALTRAFVHEYQWFHLAMGLLGNIAFVIGSVFFLWESLKPAGVWLFIIGSAGMLLGSIGGAVVTYERAKGRMPGDVQERTE